LRAHSDRASIRAGIHSSFEGARPGTTASQCVLAQREFFYAEAAASFVN
jgi:hypothetical protein